MLFVHLSLSAKTVCAFTFMTTFTRWSFHVCYLRWRLLKDYRPHGVRLLALWRRLEFHGLWHPMYHGFGERNKDSPSSASLDIRLVLLATRRIDCQVLTKTIALIRGKDGLATKRPYYDGIAASSTHSPIQCQCSSRMPLQ